MAGAWMGVLWKSVSQRLCTESPLFFCSVQGVACSGRESCLWGTDLMRDHCHKRCHSFLVYNLGSKPLVSVVLLIKDIYRDGKVAQSVKCLPHKHEGLSLPP